MAPKIRESRLAGNSSGKFNESSAKRMGVGWYVEISYVSVKTAIPLIYLQLLFLAIVWSL